MCIRDSHRAFQPGLGGLEGSVFANDWNLQDRLSPVGKLYDLPMVSAVSYTHLIRIPITIPPKYRATMASRTLPSERDRKMTILLTPFMSCSAKLPIYGFFAAAFFPGKAALVMIALYFSGIVMGILMALLLRHTMFSGEAVPFVMELPNYRLPGAKNVGHLLWDKAKDFLQRAFTVIFMATLVIWFLQTFDLHLTQVTDSQDSILAHVAGVIAPIFKPMGFGDWRISTALITGFLAKESVVSTLSILFGGTEALMSLLTPLAVVSPVSYTHLDVYKRQW